MDHRLYDLLRDTSIKSEDGNYMYESYYGPHVKWKICDGRYEDFWENYSDLVNRKVPNLCLGEKLEKYIPVIGYALLCFDLYEEFERNIPDSFILSLVQCYQIAIEQYLNINNDKRQFLAAIGISSWECESCNTNRLNTYETNPVAIKKSFSVEIRIQFPYCKIDIEILDQLIRPRVIQLLRQKNVISKLHHQPVHDWDRILSLINLSSEMDSYLGSGSPSSSMNSMTSISSLLSSASNSFSSSIPLYGSSRFQGVPPLNYHSIIGEVTDEHVQSAHFPRIKEKEVILPVNHIHVNQDRLSPDIFGKKDLRYWLPLFLSINYFPEITERIENVAPIKLISPNITSSSSFLVENEGKMELADRFLKMLGRHRLNKDHYWIDVGKGLYTCDDGGEDGLQQWIRWTETSDDHDADDCKVKYLTFRDNCITIKTLAWYAREDDPEEYHSWHSEWVKPALNEAGSCLHSDVAKALYRLYWLDYICGSLDRNQWYQYKNHRWIKLDQGITLRQAISEDFLSKFEAYRHSISQQVRDSKSKEMKESGEVTIKKLTCLIQNLKKVSFKQNIMKEAMEHFYDGNFNRILDTNDSILGMINCVLEIYESDVHPRPGKPEDYVSMCTGIPYRYEFTFESELVKCVLNWLGKAFVNTFLNNYFFNMASSYLKGRNSDKIFSIWSGDGNNSKSMIVKLFECAFGSYCIKFPTSMITQKRTGSSSAMPELARAKSTRIAFLQEPDDDDVIKGGIVKELTGGDSFFARFLHDNGGEVEAMFKVVLMCNKIPAIPTGGKAIRSRTRIVPFLSTWEKNPPTSEKEQYSEKRFKMDPFFEKRIPEMSQAFMWLLVQNFPKYIKEGLNEPTIVKDTTNTYWQENDIYQHFIAEKLEDALKETDRLDEKGVPIKIRDLDVSITHPELYREFKMWYKDSYPGSKVPDTATAKIEFITHLGKLQKQKWFGKKFIVDKSFVNF